MAELVQGRHELLELFDVHFRNLLFKSSVSARVSNPTLTAIQSEVQRNPPGVLRKLREMVATAQLM